MSAVSSAEAAWGHLLPGSLRLLGGAFFAPWDRGSEPPPSAALSSVLSTEPALGPHHTVPLEAPTAQPLACAVLGQRDSPSPPAPP